MGLGGLVILALPVFGSLDHGRTASSLSRAAGDGRVPSRAGPGVALEPGPDAASQAQAWLTLAFGTAAAGFSLALMLARRAVAARTAELRESEARYQALVDNSPDAVFVIRVEPDLGLTFEAGNSQLEILAGLPESEMRGRDVRTMVHPDAERHNMPYYLESIAEVKPVRFEYTIAMPDGPVSRETVIVPLTDETGRVVRLIGSSRDITARKRADAVLRQAQKMEAVGQLTSGIAHDFNNLLTVVVGGLEAVRRHRSNPERIDKYVDVALDAAGRAAKLTQQLLAFSRRQALQPKIANVNRLLDEFASLMRRAAGEAVSIRIDLAPDPACCEIDPSQFEAAILNLVVNARDAMPKGGEVAITTAPLRIVDGEDATLAPGEYVRIAVTDTGQGIPPDVLERVFEPFFTTKEVGKGSGLGLSMVYGFVQQSGGEIRIESTVGVGTQITILLPTTAAPETAPAGEPGTAAPLSGHERILLVEDNPDVRTMAAAILDELGYEVITACDGRAALDVVATGISFDLLFTDVVMPGGLSGLELIQEVRRLRPGVKVLATSGHTGGHLDTVDARAVTILSKPYHRSELAHAIRSSLDAKADSLVRETV